jgi:hypothetical protein
MVGVWNKRWNDLETSLLLQKLNVMIKESWQQIYSVLHEATA